MYLYNYKNNYIIIRIYTYNYTSTQTFNDIILTIICVFIKSLLF